MPQVLKSHFCLGSLPARSPVNQLADWPALKDSTAGDLIFASLPLQLSTSPECLRVGGKSKGFPVNCLVIRHFILGVVPGKHRVIKGSNTLSKSTQPVSSPGSQGSNPAALQTFSNLFCIHSRTSQGAISPLANPSPSSRSYMRQEVRKREPSGMTC